MSIYLYLDRNTILHHLNPITKIICLILFFVILMLFAHSLPLFFIGLFIIAISLIGRCLVNIKRIWLLMFTLALFTILLWTIFYPGKGLEQSFLYGLAMAIRLDLMIFCGLIFLSVTRTEEFTAGLNKLGLPFPVCFALSFAFRLVPTFISSAQITIQAQKARGLDLETGNIVTRIKKYLPLLIPILATSLRNAELLAIALETKGFGLKKRRTYYLDFKFGWSDFFALGITFLLVILAIVFRERFHPVNISTP